MHRYPVHDIAKQSVILTGVLMLHSSNTQLSDHILHNLSSEEDGSHIIPSHMENDNGSFRPPHNTILGNFMNSR